MLVLSVRDCSENPFCPYRQKDCSVKPGPLQGNGQNNIEN